MGDRIRMFAAGALVGAIAFGLFLKIKGGPKKLPSETKKQTIPIQYQKDKEYQQLKQQQLARVIKFFGQQKFKKLQNSFVVIFGVGGVGSHVVNMLARSGVKRIRIIDFDQVSMSSLNRHSFAVREDVGTAKVECIKKYINKIFPHIQIEGVNVYVTVQNVRTLLIDNLQQMYKKLSKKQKGKFEYQQNERKPDYIVDCIDNLDAKVQLIAACVQNNLQLMVSGGAGMKCDPTKLQIRDISDCKYDKLIMRIKRQLTKRNIKSGVKVCFSYQQTEKQLLPLTEHQQKDPNAYKVFDNYRIRIIPVLGTMPAIIGMSIASYVLCQLANQPYEPFVTDYVKSSSISKLFNELQYDIKRFGILKERVQVDIQEVSIVAKKVYNWKCLVNPEEKGDRLVIWDRSKLITIDNLVLMTKQNYEKHYKISDTIKNYSQQVFQRQKQKAEYSKRLMQSGYMMFI